MADSTAPASAGAPAGAPSSSPGSNLPPPGQSQPNGAEKQPGRPAQGTTQNPKNGQFQAKQPAEAKPPGTTPEEDLFELEIDGKKEKWDRQRVLREAQKSAAAQKRFRESAELTKKNQQLLEALKADPEGALAQLGIDVDGLAQQRLVRQWQDSQLSPEQRELRDTRKQMESLKSEHQKAIEAQQRQQRDAQEQHYAGQLEAALNHAAEVGGLAKNPDTLLQLAEIGAELAELDLPLQPQHLVAEFKAREAAQMQKWEAKLAAKDGNALLDALPPGLLEKIMRAGVARLRGGNASDAPPQQVSPMPAERPKTQYISEAEWERQRRSQRGR